VLGTIVSTRAQIVWEVVQILILSIKDSLLRECHLQRRLVMDPTKFGAIMEWILPTNVLEVRSFMVLVGYYLWFVEGFSKIENPIMELQKKNKKFGCIKKCTEAFWRLKEILKIEPILKVPDMDSEFLVCTDTSKEGLRGVLMQDGRVITYISRKLRMHEEDYATHDLEWLEIVYAL
jgi:hypothetical protein